MWGAFTSEGTEKEPKPLSAIPPPPLPPHAGPGLGTHVLQGHSNVRGPAGGLEPGASLPAEGQQESRGGSLGQEGLKPRVARNHR